MVSYLIEHPTNNITMVVLFDATVAWLWQKKPTQPPGASLEGVGQGRCGWVLFINADRLRNKLITKIYNFILIFFSSHFYLPQNNGIARPPCSPPVTHPPYTPLYCRRLLLVGWYVLSSRWRPSKAMT